MTPEQALALALAASAPAQAPSDFHLRTLQIQGEYGTRPIYYRANDFSPMGRTVTILIPGERARSVFVYEGR